jgi:hypothetical protein
MHPVAAGINLLKCNLNYASLTVAQFQAHVQACLDEIRAGANAVELLNELQRRRKGKKQAGPLSGQNP